MALEPSDLEKIAPEMAKETPERRQFILDTVYAQLPTGFWGDKLDWAAGLYACHLITVFNRKGNAETSKEKVGDVERQYNVAKSKSDAANWLCTSAYGYALWQFIKTRTITPYIAGDNGNGNPGGIPWLNWNFGFPPWY